VVEIFTLGCPALQRSEPSNLLILRGAHSRPGGSAVWSSPCYVLLRRSRL